MLKKFQIDAILRSNFENMCKIFTVNKVKRIKQSRSNECEKVIYGENIV